MDVAINIFPLSSLSEVGMWNSCSRWLSGITCQFHMGGPAQSRSPSASLQKWQSCQIPACCEHPQYCRPTMSAMTLWVLSSVGWVDLSSVGWVDLSSVGWADLSSVGWVDLSSVGWVDLSSVGWVDLTSVGWVDLTSVGWVDLTSVGWVDLTSVGWVDLTSVGWVDVASVGWVDVASVGWVDVASVGWVDLTSVGWVDVASVGWVDLTSVGWVGLTLANPCLFAQQWVHLYAQHHIPLSAPLMWHDQWLLQVQLVRFNFVLGNNYWFT